MAKAERGVRIDHFRWKHTPTDTDKANKVRKINTDIRKEADEYLENLRPRRYDKIPMKFWGKGPGGMMLYDWVHHRGRGAPKLSQRARDLIRYYGSDEERRMSKELNKRMKAAGPRYAMMK